jgi:hypothetical protein
METIEEKRFYAVMALIDTMTPADQDDIGEALTNPMRMFPPEQREKMRLAATGRKHTLETRLKIGLKSTGRKHTTEARMKIGAAASARRGKNTAL